jgi:hypothetical protein
MGSTTTEPAKVEQISNNPSSSPISLPSKNKEDSSADACQCSTRTQKNLSFVLEGVNKVRFEDRPVPELKTPNDVLVQVKYTGICGSDVRTCSLLSPKSHSSFQKPPLS